MIWGVKTSIFGNTHIGAYPSKKKEAPIFYPLFGVLIYERIINCRKKNGLAKIHYTTLNFKRSTNRSWKNFDKTSREFLPKNFHSQKPQFPTNINLPYIGKKWSDSNPRKKTASHATCWTWRWPHLQLGERPVCTFPWFGIQQGFSPNA